MSLRRHEISKYHVDAVLVAHRPQNNAGEMLSQAHCEQKKLNTHMLMTIMHSVQYLGRQGLALKGHHVTKVILLNCFEVQKP